MSRASLAEIRANALNDSYRPRDYDILFARRLASKHRIRRRDILGDFIPLASKRASCNVYSLYRVFSRLYIPLEMHTLHRET